MDGEFFGEIGMVERGAMEGNYRRHAFDAEFAQRAARFPDYVFPTIDPFARIGQSDGHYQSNMDGYGVSGQVDWDIGPVKLTSITAWRYWNWDPSNDRDFIGLPITTVSVNPSKQRQFTQEVRYTAPITSTLTFSGGVFGFYQTIDSAGRQEQGSAAARFPAATW